MTIKLEIEILQASEHVLITLLEFNLIITAHIQLHSFSNP